MYQTNSHIFELVLLFTVASLGRFKDFKKEKEE